jgi:hypothetical protein
MVADRDLECRPSLNQTAIFNFGHFCAEVPKSLHIGSYPGRIRDWGLQARYYESPASCDIRAAPLPQIGLIAMQKVEGSNPFSRFASNPLQVGHSALAAENQTTPAYRLHFGHECLK